MHSPQQTFYKNITTIKYVLLFGAIFSGLVATQVYFNYVTIVESIEETKQETIITEEETEFLMNHYKTYLESDLAKMFFAHENNLLAPDEYIVRLIDKQEETIETEQSQATGVSMTPQQGREQFLQTIVQQLTQS